ncbi:uncharacterized protein LOC124293312 [Neodiprion lecontei]|uniref:Uncharacterized protein LOC124293312 n=1 Tax=Neodiprion lecontei TaxID=441921 RepID=A0ABM3FNX5_NEOLC|nr:uncharacterized protein LOC124293312 [Neodiprion lecontei]
MAKQTPTLKSDDGSCGFMTPLSVARLFKTRPILPQNQLNVPEPRSRDSNRKTLTALFPKALSQRDSAVTLFLGRRSLIPTDRIDTELPYLHDVYTNAINKYTLR